MKLLIILILVGVLIALAVFPYAGEFHDFYSAGQNVLAGQNPYTDPRYYSPIWVAIAFAPLALLPEELAWRLYAGVSFVLYAVILFRLLPNRRLAWLALLSPFLFAHLWNGNIEWAVLWGIVLPPPLGMWLLLAKPQMALGVVLLIVWQLRPKPRALLITFVPVGLVLLVSVVLGMGRLADFTQLGLWNTSLFPFSVLIGLPLLIYALRKNQTAPALVAGPLCSPYVLSTTWVAVLPLAAQHWLVLIPVIIVCWAWELNHVFGILDLVARMRAGWP
jgi:hypothetical protein